LEQQYDRRKLEQEFDSLPEASPIADIDPFKGDIIAMVGALALDFLELGADDVLLDIGTGRGRWAVAASQHCKKVIGIDISKRMLEDARMNVASAGAENVEFYRGSFEDPCEETDISQKNVNKIVAIYSLHHLTDSMKAEAISKLSAMLKRPGRIVVGDIMWFDDPGSTGTNGMRSILMTARQIIRRASRSCERSLKNLVQKKSRFFKFIRWWG
jgi:ubiquinone/menaquinone biosynthesis C-methylase UbiE